MRDFKTIDEQIKILKDRKLIFINEETAKLNLMRYGYYEIINGYKDFMLESRDPDVYKKGATFEHLFELYKLDKSFKNSVLESSLNFELNLKTSFSYVLSKKFGVKNNSYLDKSLYKLGKKDKDGVYQLDYLFNKFDLIINDNLEPYKHYREDHGHTPPWILFKGCSFGNMKHFYNLQKGFIKDEITSLMLGYPIELVKQLPECKALFFFFFNLKYIFRNRAAHSGRIYNYTPKYGKIRYNKIFHQINIININEAEYRLGYGTNDLYTLTVFLKVLENKIPSLDLMSSLIISIEDHLEKYPEDRLFLLSSIGVPKNRINNDIRDIF